jgi:hypothetical protein
MNYFIKEREWKEIFKILRSLKNIHTKNEAYLRQFIEAIWYVSRTGDCFLRPMATGVPYIEDLKNGVIREYGKLYFSKVRMHLTWKLL